MPAAKLISHPSDIGSSAPLAANSLSFCAAASQSAAGNFTSTNRAASVPAGTVTLALTIRARAAWSSFQPRFASVLSHDTVSVTAPAGTSFAASRTANVTSRTSANAFVLRCACASGKPPASGQPTSFFGL